jgi:hypothetical protein
VQQIGSSLGRKIGVNDEVEIMRKEFIMSYLKAVTKFSAATEANHELHEHRFTS